MAAFLPFLSLKNALAPPCQATEPLDSPVPPAQGSCPQPQGSFPSQTPHEGQPFGAGCRAGRARSRGGGPINAGRAGEQQGLLEVPTGQRWHTAPWGWGWAGGCTRALRGSAPLLPQALLLPPTFPPVPKLSFCPQCPLKARLAPERRRPRHGPGQRSATSSPASDQTIRAKASPQILPPPWETTQQHSRYLPG